MAPPALRPSSSSSRSRPTCLAIPSPRPRRALPHAPLRRVPRACRRSDPRLQRTTASPVPSLCRVLRPSSGAHQHREQDHHSRSPARCPLHTGTTEGSASRTLSFRAGGRSQPAPTARLIPAGRLFRAAGATRVPVLVAYLRTLGITLADLCGTARWRQARETPGSPFRSPASQGPT